MENNSLCKILTANRVHYGGFEIINSSWGAWNVRRELKWVLRDDKNRASRVSKVSKTAKESFVKSNLGPL